MLGVALIEATLLLILIVTVIKFMLDSANEALLKRASTTATLFATTTKDAVLSYDLASLEAFVSEVLKNPDIEYARVLGGDDTIFAEGGKTQYLQKTFVMDSDVSSVDDGIFDTQAMIQEGGETYGKVQIGISINSISLAMDRVTTWTISIAAIEMLLVALFSYMLGVYLTKNLIKLRGSASRIARSINEGDYQMEEVNIPGQDELSDVAKAFNQLSITLEKEHDRRTEFEDDLRELNQNLELKVERRTEQLLKQNQQLEQINQELQSTQEQLLQSEKMASVGQLAAGVAHEINNPIGFVGSNLGTLNEYITPYKRLSELVLEYMASKDKTQRKQLASQLFSFAREQDLHYINQDIGELLQESIKGLERVTDIVKSLKQFAHVDTDDKQMFDLNECVTTTLNMVNNELKYHCQIETELAALPETAINVGKVIQVLTNLLINAGQAIEDSGFIYISTQVVDDNIQLKIKDTGKGIKPQDIKDIFNPFFTTKPVGQGTGLGLSICFDIIQEHGGNIRVASELGKGTCFTIELPVTENKQTPLPIEAQG